MCCNLRFCFVYKQSSAVVPHAKGTAQRSCCHATAAPERKEGQQDVLQFALLLCVQTILSSGAPRKGDSAEILLSAAAAPEQKEGQQSGKVCP